MAHSDEIKQTIDELRNREDATPKTLALLLIAETLNEINWTQTYVKKNIENISRNINQR